MQKLFYNGPIITMEDAKPVEALLIEDDTIKAVGKLAEAEALAKDAERIDLEGRTLMPAFVDAHSHFAGACSSFTAVSMAEAKSLDDIVKLIQDYIRENNIAPGDWVRAVAYDQNSLKEERHPDAAVLDRAAPDNPVSLNHVSGHMGVLNTRGLTLLNVPAEEDAVPGGKIFVKDGKPTGYLEEAAWQLYMMKVPGASQKEFMTGFMKAQNQYLSNGITISQESVGLGMMIPLYKGLINAGLLKLNIVGYPGFNEAEPVYKELGNLPPGSPFRLGGYKMLLDGSPQGRTAWMRKPYIDSTDYCAYGTMTDEDVYHNICKAATEGKQVLAHCNGDAAAEQYIAMIEKAEANGYDVAKIRPVMIHAQLLGRDQLARVKKAGIIPSFYVAHTWHWGDIHLKNFGAERANYISPTGSALREGILFTFHQDTPVIPCDMIETLWCATNRITKKGKQLSTDECISVYEAMRAVTINSAYQYFEEDVRGSLKPGKKADVIILSENPLTYPKENLRDIKVLATFKNGNCLYKRA